MIRFTIPGEFVWRVARPGLGTVAYGFQEGWLRREGVIDICLRRTLVGDVNPFVERLAYLLRDEIDSVDQILTAAEADPTEEEKGCWIYITSAWVYENREVLSDPFGIAEMLYSEFGYPEEMEGFIRYMPLPPGTEPGMDGLLAHWADYLKAKGYRP
ncbi:hypothetical protein SAMN05421505_1644 [Sinosporangium album]|uniref:DUF2247 family protein n=1 Tax=Sinosporangium album TaxID=504805 RepID=A0A1G8LBP8_9ACTN|nr:DUF2247 family protein [Sinosporangium album]SDI53076.1 hypothetical protein SAMN05421505_1644 [Sinosporangium album]